MKERAITVFLSLMLLFLCALIIAHSATPSLVFEDETVSVTLIGNRVELRNTVTGETCNYRLHRTNNPEPKMLTYTESVTVRSEPGMMVIEEQDRTIRIHFR